MSVTRYHVELTQIDSAGNQSMIYPKTTVSDVYTDSKSGISIEGKLNFFGVCTTPAGTPEKSVTVPGFVTKSGAKLDVKFTYKPTTTTISLKVNSGVTYPIYYKGKAINPTTISGNTVLSMVFNGTQFDVVGIIGSLSAEEDLTKNIYLLGTASGEGSNIVETLNSNRNVYIQGGTNMLVATGFIGKGTKITELSASNITSGTLSKDRLSNSGVTAKTYGPTANASVSIGTALTIPSFTVDSKGRITSAADRKITVSFENASLDTSIEFADSGTTFRGIVGKNATSDSWRVGGSGTASDSGYLELATADNGIEPIYVRQYSDKFTTVTRTATLLDGSGNTSFPGLVKATGGFSGNLSGNATSATKLATARTLTIGKTGKTFNGTANVSWTLAEIGAAASSHTHTYSQLSPVHIEDWNTATKTGFYYGGGTNAPYAGNWYGRVTAHGNDNEYSIYQEIYQTNYYADSKTTSYDIPKYARTFHYGEWKPWVDMNVLNQIKNAGVGTMFNVHWAIYGINNGDREILSTSDSSKLNGLNIICPAGTWLILHRIYTSSIPGPFNWHLDDGNDHTFTQWHCMDKTKGKGSYETLYAMDIVTFNDNHVIRPVFTALADPYDNSTQIYHSLILYLVRIC